MFRWILIALVALAAIVSAAWVHSLLWPVYTTGGELVVLSEGGSVSINADVASFTGPGGGHVISTPRFLVGFLLVWNGLIALVVLSWLLRLGVRREKVAA
jgi:hypothetical protein